METPVPEKDYKQIASYLMEKEPTAEQVGFLDTKDPGILKLNMAGGEFCGNATMSAAVYAVMKGLQKSPVKLRVSGAKQPLRVEVTLKGNSSGDRTGAVNASGTVNASEAGKGAGADKGAWTDKGAGADNASGADNGSGKKSMVKAGPPKYTGLVKMPAPLEIREVSVKLGGKATKVPAVIFEGITHIILNGIGIAKKLAEQYVKDWSEELDMPCLGLMFYDAGKNRLKPLVYVKSPQTLVWEQSCGSGSVAEAAYLYQRGTVKDVYEFSEPGGRLRVVRKGKSFYLEGEVILEKESAAQTRIPEVLARLDEEYGTDYKCYLNHENAWQLLFATILSAQCTDERVNIVTKDLFVKYPDPGAFANADLKELEQDIRSTGFYHNKAKNLIACAQALLERHGGEVPSDIESLTALPGVGRKTANVIRGNIYHIDSIVVDTHVKRISNKLGFTTEEDPVKIEFDLMEKLPRDHWILYNIHIIRLGRTICKAPTPKCEECFLRDLCPSAKPGKTC